MATKGDPELQAMEESYQALSSLPEDAQQRVLEWLRAKLGISTREVAAGSGFERIRTVSSKLGGVARVYDFGASPKAFMSDKKPKNDVERVAALAYYLTHMRNQPEFKTKDITVLNREAGLPPFGNPAMAVANAARQNQFLAPAGKGMKQITMRGEALVDALPDRDRVVEALTANPLVGRKKKRVKGRK